MQNFSSWLLEELDQHNMSRSDLARACNISTSQISLIASGKRNAGAKSLTKIAQALNLPVDFVCEKAGLLSPNSELSPIQRKIFRLVKQLSTGDLETILALIEGDALKVRPSLTVSKG
jgi:transcriptional regulator with XRE-family HTH domain